MNNIIRKTGTKSKLNHTVEWIVYKGKMNSQFFMHFITGQFLLQGFNLLNGFFLLRWLSITEQAKFSIAFSIQTLIMTLSDLGFTGSIIALVGRRFHDKKIVGSYIQSAKHLRKYLFVFSCIVTMVFLPFIIKKHSWSYIDLVLLLLPVLFSVFWQADASLYDSTLVMHRKIKELYKPQVGIAAFKLTTNFLLYTLNVIGALSTLVVNAISLFATGRIFKKKALPYIDFSEKDHTAERKEMMRYLKPLFPSLVFNALYGQIQIFLISFFGKTANIAEVAALGRLGQLFIFLGSVNAVIVSPVIAKASESEVPKKYFFMVGASLTVAGIVFSVSFFKPDLFLFLLGPKYFHLKHILPLAILSSCISYIGGVIWTMNSARKWLFWWVSIVYIGSIVACQVYAIFYFDLSKTKGVLLLSLLTATVILLVQISLSLVGFRKEKTSQFIQFL